MFKLIVNPFIKIRQHTEFSHTFHTSQDFCVTKRKACENLNTRFSFYLGSETALFKRSTNKNTGCAILAQDTV
jgi:hypothetical protein